MPVVVDDLVLELLDDRPDGLPLRLATMARQRSGGPAAFYELDLEGRVLTRMAGDDELPGELWLTRRIGPVLFRGCERELQESVGAIVAGGVAHPLWLLGQADAVLVTAGGDGDLAQLTTAGAVALEVMRQHTDVFHEARRRKPTTPAAELQQDLLPPPLTRVGSTVLAGSMLPAYTVGGDWFDWSQHGDDLRLSIGDGVGRGESAMAVGAVALSANRAVRRRGDGIEEAAAAINRAVRALGQETFVTCLLASWDPAAATMSWVRGGHPPPLILDADGRPRDVSSKGYLPLGVYDEEPSFVAEQERLEPGERFILYSDGITEARTPDDGFFGLGGVVEAAAGVTGAVETARAILDAVEALGEEIYDDATLVVLHRDQA